MLSQSSLVLAIRKIDWIAQFSQSMTIRYVSYSIRAITDDRRELCLDGSLRPGDKARRRRQRRFDFLYSGRSQKRSFKISRMTAKANDATCVIFNRTAV